MKEKPWHSEFINKEGLRTSSLVPIKELQASLAVTPLSTTASPTNTSTLSNVVAASRGHFRSQRLICCLHVSFNLFFFFFIDHLLSCCSGPSIATILKRARLSHRSSRSSDGQASKVLKISFKDTPQKSVVAPEEAQLTPSLCSKKLNCRTPRLLTLTATFVLKPKYKLGRMLPSWQLGIFSQPSWILRKLLPMQLPLTFTRRSRGLCLLSCQSILLGIISGYIYSPFFLTLLFLS